MGKSLANFKILLLIAFFAINASAQNQRPKIGLTLSGGGAKGIAHVGLLMAIDSVGLKVDYVTGTSMGSVVGGLYAAGYSGKEILLIARRLKWETLLTNDPPLNSLSVKEREHRGEFIELPFDNGKLAFQQGFIESNEMWLALAELYYPYYEITDFNKFDKKFQCIATDLSNGEMVVLDKGNIVKAIRASMAIPSVFTPVEINGKLLVDGGVARNFPVANAKAMGAKIVIGSDVSENQIPVDKLKSPLEVYGRLPFYKAVADLEEQRKLADIYVDYPLEKYSSNSFSSADKLLEIGIKKGKELYPVLKHLKDSLDLIYGPEKIEKTVIKRDSVFISEYEMRGLPPNETPLFLKLINFKPNSYYTAKDLTTALRSAFATRDFTRINYTLIPAKEGSARIIFDVEKAPGTAIRLGVNYNTATGIALKAGLVKRNFLTSFSTASFAIAVGENQRAKGAFSQYLTKSRRLILQATTSGETTDITTYDANFSESGRYNQSSLNADVQLLWQPNLNWLFGFGTTLDNVVYDPKVTSERIAEGNVHFLNSYFVLQHNSLNASLYPTKGSRLYLQAGVVYNQHVHFTIYKQEDIVATQDSPYFDSKPYTQLKFTLEHYVPVGANAMFVQLQTAMNFNYHQAIMNEFVIGGLNNIIRNQVNFAGLPEASVFSSSVVSLQLGYQYEVFNNFFLTGKINGLAFDFIKSNYRYNSSSHGMGYALTAGYKTLFGPIEASLMYSDLNHKILPYFNIGYVLSL